jgi:DNA-binding GntR family transcriptional regulator
MPDDMDADYSPQYVKLARALRAKITSGELADSSTLAAGDVATEYHVSVRVAYAALDMLAANHYLTRPPGTRHHRVNARTSP